MSILKVGSTNPKLSWILQKNPETINESKKPFTRKVRKGVAYGWFNQNASEFKLWFKDHDTESSFADGIKGEFEYLDATRYGSPYIPISLISNCLATAAKKLDENDVGGFEAYATTVIKVPNIRFQEMITKHYAGVATVEATPLHGDFYVVTVKASKIYTVLNVMQIVCLMQCLCDDDTYVSLREADIEKYINCLNAAAAPYFVRYLFSTRAFSNRKTFDKLKDKLQGPGMVMQFGNTRQQRFDAIADTLRGGETLIDIGCGEMFYSLRLCGKYETVYAVDPDAELQEANRGRVEKRQIENLVPLEEWATPQWAKENEGLFDGADVLLTEVIEHMPIENAKALIQAILDTNYRQLVVTTPNKDFNKNYGFSEGQTRHEDHKWEIGGDDFSKLMLQISEDQRCGVMLWPIGDLVDGDSVTSMALFVRDKSAESPALQEAV